MSDFKKKSQQTCDFWNSDHKDCVENVRKDFNSEPDSCGCKQPCRERVLQKSGEKVFLDACYTCHNDHVPYVTEHNFINNGHFFLPQIIYNTFIIYLRCQHIDSAWDLNLGISQSKERD